MLVLEGSLPLGSLGGDSLVPEEGARHAVVYSIHGGPGFLVSSDLLGPSLGPVVLAQ